MRRPVLLAIAATLCMAQSVDELASGDSTGFVEGAVCAGVDIGANASAADMLRGKHLKLYEAQWAPFASVDPTAPYGFRGYNIDLIAAVAQELGFTYEIHLMEVATNGIEV